MVAQVTLLSLVLQIWLYWAKFTASLVSLGRRAFYIHPTDALHGDLGRLSSGDTLVALSFSGESREVVNFVKYVKKNFQVPVIVLAKVANLLLENFRCLY